MPETMSAAPAKSERPSASSSTTAPMTTAASGTTKIKEATRLASPARTRPKKSIHASPVPTNAEYRTLEKSGPDHETADEGSIKSPSAVSTAPPTRNGRAIAQSVEMRASYFLNATVPSAQESAEATPETTPTGVTSPAASSRPPELTATMPAKPSSRPATLVAVNGSPSTDHASTPTRMGWR